MARAILGLDINDRNTSAAIVVDGTLLAAVQEERLSREKLTRRLPTQAVRYCLGRAGIEIGEVDAVAVSVNPAIYLENLSPVYSERVRYRGELLYAPVSYLMGLAGARARAGAHLRVPLATDVSAATPGGELSVHYVRHHDCHAATAFYASPFDEAAILSADGYGETETTVFYHARGTDIRRLHQIEFPHSIGMVYAALTEYLGLRPFHDEWKLMAAASSGDPAVLAPMMRTLMHTTEDGGLEVNLPFFNYYQFHRPGLFSSRLEDLLGPRYAPGDEPDQRFFDIAAGAQRLTEEVMLDLVRHLATLVPSRKVCLTGGVAMNCVVNGKISELTPFDQVFVPAMPDDSGTSIGAAFHVHHAEGGQRVAPMVHNYLGPSYDDEAIEAELVRAKLHFERLHDGCRTAAELIAGGLLVGWFQGGVEFGDRALGNRSILADPREPQVPERLASLVKDRASYQPFAPAVLAERAGDFFEARDPSPFMDKACRVRPAVRERIPAVVAADGSARVQTVTEAQNPAFHRLLVELDRITGIPVVLNTSFNLSGEPIVCSPRDAIRTFYASGLDALVMSTFLLKK